MCSDGAGGGALRMQRPAAGGRRKTGDIAGFSIAVMGLSTVCAVRAPG